MKPEQLALDLAPRPALGRADFVVTTANAAALAMVEAERWPGGRLALTGPAAVGKTHLAHVWASATGAAVVPAAELARHDIEALAAGGRVAVEDVPGAAGVAEAETTLFHLHNRMASGGGYLLLTGRAPPAAWPMALPDLNSRVTALTAAAIAPPDDALLGALLEKQLADRGVEVSGPVLLFLVARMRRSAAAASALAGEIDRLSLARRRPVTVPLARLALERLSAPSHEPPSKEPT